MCSCCLGAAFIEPNFRWHLSSCTSQLVLVNSPLVLFSCCFCYRFCAYIALLLWSGLWSCQWPWCHFATTTASYMRSGFNGNGSLHHWGSSFLFRWQGVRAAASWTQSGSPFFSWPFSDTVIAPCPYRQWGRGATVLLPCTLCLLTHYRDLLCRRKPSGLIRTRYLKLALCILSILYYALKLLRHFQCRWIRLGYFLIYHFDKQDLPYRLPQISAQTITWLSKR